jgi:hypothetical protein
MIIRFYQVYINSCCSLNKIAKIYQGCFPSQLKELWLRDTGITKLDYIPENLQILYLNNDKENLNLYTVSPKVNTKKRLRNDDVKSESRKKSRTK